ncbi:hypothetical protein [Mucilaginibacter phyllosphaerae]
MEDIKKISAQRLEMLLEAMEMLQELRGYMAMFRNQRYCKLQGRVDDHTRQTEMLKMDNDK